MELISRGLIKVGVPALCTISLWLLEVVVKGIIYASLLWHLYLKEVL